MKSTIFIPKHLYIHSTKQLHKGMPFWIAGGFNGRAFKPTFQGFVEQLGINYDGKLWPNGLTYNSYDHRGAHSLLDMNVIRNKYNDWYLTTSYEKGMKIYDLLNQRR